MFILRAATAGQTIEFGPFVSTSDAVTPCTSAIAANDIKLFKNQATATVNKNSGAATYLANGYYYATFDATDTDTIGRLKVTINMTSGTGASTAMAVWFDAMVVSSQVYDSFWNTTGVNLQVDTVRIAGASSSAVNFSSAARSIQYGTVVSTVAVPTVSTLAVNWSFAAMPADGQLQNRQVIFDLGTVTAGLRLQAAQVSTWTAATSTMVVTPPFSVTPAHGDTIGVY